MARAPWGPLTPRSHTFPPPSHHCVEFRGTTILHNLPWFFRLLPGLPGDPALSPSKQFCRMGTSPNSKNTVKPRARIILSAGVAHRQCGPGLVLAAVYPLTLSPLPACDATARPAPCLAPSSGFLANPVNGASRGMIPHPSPIP